VPKNQDSSAGGAAGIGSLTADQPITNKKKNVAEQNKRVADLLQNSPMLSGNDTSTAGFVLINYPAGDSWFVLERIVMVVWPLNKEPALTRAP
jgi:hypothetical protein